MYSVYSEDLHSKIHLKIYVIQYSAKLHRFIPHTPRSGTDSFCELGKSGQLNVLFLIKLFSSMAIKGTLWRVDELLDPHQRRNKIISCSTLTKKWFLRILRMDGKYLEEVDFIF
jgi:hypothetical protein